MNAGNLGINERKELKVLIAEAGDDVTTIDAYSDASEQMVNLITKKLANATITLVSNYLKAALRDQEDVREHITALVRNIYIYDLVLAYIPGPHMLNAIVIWNANKHGVPVIGVCQYQNDALLSGRFSVVRDFSSLARLFESEDFLQQLM